MAEKKVIELEVKTDSVGNLKSELRKAQAEVAELSAKFGVTSEEAVKAAKKAAELKDAIGEAKALTDAFNPDAKFNALSSSIGGALNGFQAFEGALGLVGVESEQLQATLLKVQSAMALSQGLQGLMEAKDSFKQLGAVAMDALKGIRTGLLLTGIGAFVVVLGTVAAYWDDIKKAVGGVTEEEKKLADFRRKHEEERRDFVANESKGFASALSQLKATNAGSKERSRLITEINQKYGTTLKNLSDEAAFQQQVNQELENYLKYQTAKFKLQANEDAIVQNLKTQSKLKQQLASDEKRLTELFKQGALERKQTYETDDFGKRVSTGLGYANEQLAIEYEKVNKRIIENNSELKAAETRFENYGKAALRAGNEISKLTNNGKKYVEQNKEVVTTTKESTEELKNQELEILKLDTVKATEVENTNKAEESKYNYLVYWGNLTNDYYNEQRAKREAEIQRNKEFAIQAAQDTLALINTIAEIYGKRGEKQAKRAFEIQKAASIASAVIATYQSAVSAYQSQFVPIPDPSSPIRGAIAAGIAVATGLANVAKIASQKFEGGGSPAGGGGGNTTVPSGGASTITPNFNIVGNAQATNPLAGLGNQPLQAYVVSGEVTTAQNLDRNRINYATFG